MNHLKHSSLFDFAKAFVLHTSRHVFLTGRAGTGKTTFLKTIKEDTSKNTVIVAPTGVAAINAGGVTIHSFFQLPFGFFLPHDKLGFGMGQEGIDRTTLLKNIRFNKEKRRLLEELELLVIDEVSMLRADVLDAMDSVLRYFRKQPDIPFGGVQVLYIGDLYQLPPVVKDEEWSVLREYYSSIFFFDSLVLAEKPPLTIELDVIYRQSDDRFISLLNDIRNNTIRDHDLQHLNKYYDPYFYPEPEDGYIMLTSHNYKADKVNQNALARLSGDASEFEGILKGDFNEYALPVEKKLVLKEGAQVMFIRNDKGEQRRYYNGKIATVSKMKKDEIRVRFPGEKEEMLLDKETWRNIRYQYNEASGQIDEEELGAYTQYPVRLAWAVTIHKSQGLTFERAIIDAGDSFAPGQVYVALSRLTSLDGLVLSSQITSQAVQTESKILSFANGRCDISFLADELQYAQKEYLADRLLKSFSLEKTLVLFQEHHSGYATLRLPHQDEAVDWSVTAIRDIIRLKDVADKFRTQLLSLIAVTDTGGYQLLSDRVAAAARYFQNEIHQYLLTRWQEHFDNTKVKAKTKKYLRSLQPLYLSLLRKKQEIEQSRILAEGMALGKNMTHLLEHYQSTCRLIPEKAEYAVKTGAEKEDSKTISLRMFREGKSIADIAVERGLVAGTIEAHLLSFIPSGVIDAAQIVLPEKQMIIRQAIQRNPGKSITELRDLTGHACSYNEIRAVLLQTDREEKA